MSTRRTQRELSDYEYRMARWTAEAATCPRCNATGRADLPPDAKAEHCRNPYTGLVIKAPAHFQRIDAANQPEQP